MICQYLVPGQRGRDSVPRHRMPGATHDIVTGPILSASWERLREEQPCRIAAMRARAQQRIDSGRRSGLRHLELREVDERLPTFLPELGTAADALERAQFRNASDSSAPLRR
jgi:hypothetical protein